MHIKFSKTTFTILAFSMIPGLVHCGARASDPATISVANRTANKHFKLGFGARSKCGYKVWNSFNLPGGKLTPAQGTLKIAECHGNPRERREWQEVFIDIINKTSAHKRITIDSKFPCIKIYETSPECVPDNIVIFFKENNGTVEVHRTRLDNARNEVDDRVIATLQPNDYL